jgi:acetate---CoA ligase (ADP-forming)
MISGVRGLTILKGYRGKPPSDLEALERVLVGVSSMVLNHPEISEMDINPLIVHEKGKGVTAADCRIILAIPEELAT